MFFTVFVLSLLSLFSLVVCLVVEHSSTVPRTAALDPEIGLGTLRCSGR